MVNFTHSHLPHPTHPHNMSLSVSLSISFSFSFLISLLPFHFPRMFLVLKTVLRRWSSQSPFFVAIASSFPQEHRASTIQSHPSHLESHPLPQWNFLVSWLSLFLFLPLSLPLSLSHEFYADFCLFCSCQSSNVVPINYGQF